MNDPHSITATPTSAPSALRAFLLDEWPYLLVLALALFGIVSTILLRAPMTVYWILVAPVVGAVCVLSRWSELPGRAERMRLARTQAMHWGAVLVAMHLMFVTDVARIMDADASALAALVLLALGTFTAGVHLAVWRLCLIGAVMAAAVPGIVWLGRTALLWLVAALAVAAVTAPIAWEVRRLHKTAGTPRAPSS
jgi:hypothetical protein